MATLLTARWVLPVAGSTIENGAVLVEGSKIKKVGARKDLEKAKDQEETLDLGDAVLMPGFIDAHTHFESAVFRGVCDDLSFAKWKIQVSKKEAALDEDDFAVSARLGAIEAIRSGITCVGDTCRTEASFKVLKDAGLRGTIFYEFSGMDPATTDEVLKEGADKVASWRKSLDKSLIDVGFSPHSCYTVSPPLFRAISERAQEEDLPLSFHLAGSKDEYLFVKYGSSELATSFRELMGWEDFLWQPLGVSPVKYLDKWGAFDGRAIAVHCVQVNESDLDILQSKHVSIVHCPKCSAKLGMGVAPLPKFRERNLKVGLGTDSAASNNTMDVFDEMRTGLLIQRGVSQSVEHLGALDFLRMATLGGAQTLGVEDKVGTLESGKEADIIGVGISHSHQVPVRDPCSALVYTATQEDLIFTMVGGRVLFEKGEVKTFEEKAVLEEADSVRSKVY